jgi:hypothetical protein
LSLVHSDYIKCHVKLSSWCKRNISSGCDAICFLSDALQQRHHFYVLQNARMFKSLSQYSEIMSEFFITLLQARKGDTFQFWQCESYVMCILCYYCECFTLKWHSVSENLCASH